MKTLAEKIQDKYIVDDNGCWRWTAYLNAKGYGTMFHEGKTLLAHRASWIVAGKELPDDMELCHRCDTRDCINPDHLFVGTHQDNMTDMVEKKRHVARYGWDNNKTKLSRDDVLFIRGSGASINTLAAMFGVSRTAIRLVQKGINHANVTAETQDTTQGQAPQDHANKTIRPGAEL